MPHGSVRRRLTTVSVFTALGWSSWHCGTEAPVLNRGVAGSGEAGRAAGAAGKAASDGEGGGPSGGEAGAPNDAGGAPAEPGGSPGGDSQTPGDRCATAERVTVTPADARIEVSVSETTRGAADDAKVESAACAGVGAAPDRFYLLDLAEFAEPVRVRAVLDADFDAVLALEQGGCEDPRTRLCDRAWPAGRSASMWTAELDPGEHRIMVDGASSGASGRYRLTFVIEPLDATCGGYENASCDAAAPLSIELPVANAFIAPSCLDDESEEQEALYYLLDLSAETSVVGIRAAVQTALGLAEPTPEDEGVAVIEIGTYEQGASCSELVVPSGLWDRDGVTVSAALPPGRYVLVLDDPPPFPSFLSVSVTRPDCSGNQHDTCAEAEDIPLDTGHAIVSADTFCNTDQVSIDDCSGDSPTPDRFYRVDLRDRPGRVRLRASLPLSGLDFYAGLALLREEDGDCGEALFCYDSLANGDGWSSVDAVLEPGVYLLAIEPMEPSAAGHFVLEVDVSNPGIRDFRPCYDADVDDCVFFFNDALGECCSNPFGADCGTRFISCGLDPAVQDCVCETDARCCNGAEDAFDRCASVLAECNFFCGVDPITRFTCLDGPELHAAAVP
jgi:hypothetical protein